MENELVQLARQYVMMEIGPQSEVIVNKLFDLAAQVEPKTKAGRAIVAWIKDEERTDFSMSANDKYEAMSKILTR